MKSKNQILDELWKSNFIDDMLETITSGHHLMEDLKSELFLILLSMEERRIQRAWSNNYLHYLCVNIAKKQYHSSTSPFHTKFRKGLTDEELPEDSFEIKLGDDFEVVEKIIHFVDTKVDLVDRELFKIYYKIGDYDRWLGKLRDKTCEKPISSLRKVEKKLAITTIDGKAITIGRDTIRLSLDRTLMRIKHYLKENELLD